MHFILWIFSLQSSLTPLPCIEPQLIKPTLPTSLSQLCEYIFYGKLYCIIWSKLKTILIWEGVQGIGIPNFRAAWISSWGSGKWCWKEWETVIEGEWQMQEAGIMIVNKTGSKMKRVGKWWSRGREVGKKNPLSTIPPPIWIYQYIIYYCVISYPF